MQLPIVYFGDPVLRKKASTVEQFTEDLAILAQNMLETMDANNGVGLAAPQIGLSLRLFILRNYIEHEDGRISLTDPQAFVNPKITVLDDRTQEDDEGCVSIPHLRGTVVRPYNIHVEAFDLKGEPFSETVEGYKARVIMHENDHINGVLFIDRMDPQERKKLAAGLQAIKKKYSK